MGGEERKSLSSSLEEMGTGLEWDFVESFLIPFSYIYIYISKATERGKGRRRL